MRGLTSGQRVHKRAVGGGAGPWEDCSPSPNLRVTQSFWVLRAIWEKGFQIVSISFVERCRYFCPVTSTSS